MNRKIVGTVGVFAVVTLSACGSSTDAHPAAKNRPSASVASSPTTPPQSTGPGGSVDGQILAKQMADAVISSKTAHAILAGTTVSGEADFEFGYPGKSAMKMAVQGLKIEAIQVGGFLYIKGIPDTPRPWVKIDPKGTDALAKAMKSVVDSSQGSDPRLLALMVEGLTGEDLGSEQVGGVSTEHYAFQVPISVYVKPLSPKARTAVKKLMTTPVAMDYWIGNDDLPRKILTVSVLSGKRHSSESTWSNWGTPLSIVAPPAAQVVSPPSTQVGWSLVLTPTHAGPYSAT